MEGREQAEAPAASNAASRSNPRATARSPRNHHAGAAGSFTPGASFFSGRGKTAQFHGLPQRHGSCQPRNEESPMNTNDRRLIVNHSFDCTVEAVIDAFLREGFTIRPVVAGDLRQHSAPGYALRYAVLEITLPELALAAGRVRIDSAAEFASQIAVYELVGKCTLVTAASAFADAPQWASLAPRLTARLESALCAITRASAGTEAA